MSATAEERGADVPPYRILIVDDEPEILDIYRRILRAREPHGETGSTDRDHEFDGDRTASHRVYSFDVTSCQGGAEAIEMARGARKAGMPFHVAFIDVRMAPGPDGIEVAARIRKLDSNIQIVIATAFADTDPADIVRAVPPADKLFYVQKPLHVPEIRQFAVALGAKWHAERRLRRLQEELEATVAARTAELEQLTERLRQELVANRTATAEAQKAKHQAEAANRSKSEFLANMSHELRTPLNAVIGFSDMMRNELLGPVGNPQYLSYATDIHNSGEHLLGLINDILDISKIGAGEMELYEEPVDIARIVRSSLTLVKTRAQEGGVTLQNHATGPLPALNADARKIKQIVINLLSNAVKFTPTDGTVTIAAAIEDDGCFSILVKDTGIGIAPEDIEKVLNPFIQADSTLARKYEGTGLGLPLVRSLVELHGGRFDLRSMEGVGTSAIVRLPAERVLSAPFPAQRLGFGEAR
ncbi:MAG: ATP-binding protein [Proteobacteria bacterium]|nr:ATP-binding protein [Pseudomonadota bacterium]